MRTIQGEQSVIPELIPTPINPVQAPEMNFQNVTCDQILKVILIVCGMYIGYKLITW